MSNQKEAQKVLKQMAKVINENGALKQHIELQQQKLDEYYALLLSIIFAEGGKFKDKKLYIPFDCYPTIYLGEYAMEMKPETDEEGNQFTTLTLHHYTENIQ